MPQDERDPDELFNELCSTFMELLINVGLISTISGRWSTRVQNNWIEKLEKMKEWAHHEVAEVQSFAEAYDG